MLNEIVVKEKYVVENGKVYAYAEGMVNSKRKVDGCEARKEVSELLNQKLNKKELLEQELSKLVSDITELQKTDNALASLGFCKIDCPIYSKIDGIVMKDKDSNPIVKGYTHQHNCSNKGV